MDSRLAKNIIGVLRQERQRREALLANLHPVIADDQWLFSDLPFIAELCLMLLVALRHQVERNLVRFAARATDNGKEIDPEQYRKRVEEVRKELRKGSKGWKTIDNRLQLKSCEGEKQVDALRILANCYKHESSREPTQDLLRLLNLETGVQYAQLRESGELWAGMAVFIGLERDADYCDIVERFTDIVESFLADVQKKTKLSRVKWGAASLRPEDWAR